MVASSSTPAAKNVVPGTDAFEFLKVDFTATGENMTLSSLVVNLYEGSVASEDGTPNADSADFSNVKLWHGSTQLGSTSASPTTTSSFSFNLTLPQNELVTLRVTADVPADAESSAWDSNTASMQFDQDITATGVWSAATVTDPTDEVESNLMTAVAETLTVAFTPVPYATIIVGGDQAVVSKVILTAGSAGDVRVTSMQFDADDDTGLAGDGDGLTPQPILPLGASGPRERDRSGQSVAEVPSAAPAA